MRIIFTTQSLYEGATTKDGKPFEGGVTAYRKDLHAGTAAWMRNDKNETVALSFVCPCGCGAVQCCAVKSGYGSYVWNWNNDQFNPTLMPSIRIIQGCLWHGYLTNGEFKAV